MKKHTKEPWVIAEYNKEAGTNLIKSDEWNIAETFDYADNYSSGDNAIRIVNCVNACSGFTNEVLESIALSGDTLLDRFVAIRTKADQREELISLLRKFADNSQFYNQSILRDEAMKLIAKYEDTK